MTKQQIGKAIATARKQQGKTAYLVCKQAGIAYHQLRYIEKGTANYTVECLLQVCKTLDLEINIDAAL